MVGVTFRAICTCQSRFETVDRDTAELVVGGHREYLRCPEPRVEVLVGAQTVPGVYIGVWCRRIADWREKKGFETNKRNMLEKLMLVVTELAEAAEDVRAQNWEHFEEEIADATIRLFDIAGSLGINLEAAIAKKMEFNETRPHKHGKVA